VDPTRAGILAATSGVVPASLRLSKRRSSENSVRGSSQSAASQHLDQTFSMVPHPPKPGHITQTVIARGFAYATCRTLQPLVARQCRGPGLGRVYCLRTADKALDTNIVGSSFLRDLQVKKRETTSGLEPPSCSLGVIHQALQGVAGGAEGCRHPIFR
jgi:hypothetical protein